MIYAVMTDMRVWKDCAFTALLLCRDAKSYGRRAGRTESGGQSSCTRSESTKALPEQGQQRDVDTFKMYPLLLGLLLLLLI